MKKTGSIEGNKSKKYSQKDKEKIEQKEKDSAKKTKRKNIKKKKYTPDTFKIKENDSSEMIEYKKKAILKFWEYRDIIIAQESFEGQYLSDNDIDNLIDLTRFYFNKENILNELAFETDREERNKLGTELSKAMKEYKSAKSEYPLDSETIRKNARDIENQAQDNANPVLALVKRKEERKQRRQGGNK